jgi:hypothetical protein
MDNGTEFVSYAQWDRCARRIEMQNLERYQHSLTFTGIANLVRGYIIEIRPGKTDKTGVMLVYKGWRDAMRRASEKYRTENEEE